MVLCMNRYKKKQTANEKTCYGQVDKDSYFVYTRAFFRDVVVVDRIILFRLTKWYLCSNKVNEYKMISSAAITVTMYNYNKRWLLSKSWVLLAICSIGDYVWSFSLYVDIEFYIYARRKLFSIHFLQHVIDKQNDNCYACGVGIIINHVQYNYGYWLMI